MKAVLYYIALPFLYLISLLPFPVLYLVADFFFLLLYYVIGYRKGLVLQNLRNSFPGKTEQEIRGIRRQLYRYRCDRLIETFKTRTISPAAMLKHCSMSPGAVALFERYASENKSIILVMGHLGNWEWAGNTFSLINKAQLYVIYHPLANPYMNGLIIRMRTRFGTRLIAMKDTFKEMLSHRRELTATAFIADQTPHPDNAYWTTFLNQDTPVFLGTERIAGKLKYPVVYARVKKLKRGYYEIQAETLIEDPGNMEEGEITRIHTQRLEQDIIEQPETWLWSHRRWKHKRKPAEA